MNKVLLSVILVLTCAIQAYGLGADHPSNLPIRLGDAPESVNTLINQTNRVHGFFVNAEDRFFYAGDTSAFEAFLKQYATIKGIAGHRLIIHSGKGKTWSPWDKGQGRKPCEWMLDVALVSWREGPDNKVYRDKNSSPPKKGKKEYLVELHVWTKGDVDMKKIKVPKGVAIVYEEEK